MTNPRQDAEKITRHENLFTADGMGSTPLPSGQRRAPRRTGGSALPISVRCRLARRYVEVRTSIG